MGSGGSLLHYTELKHGERSRAERVPLTFYAENTSMITRFETAILTLSLLLAPHLHAGDSTAINEVLDSFHRAAAEADLERYTSLMAEEIVFLGTDGSERWQGRDFTDFARPHFDSGRGWAYRPRDRRLSVSGDGKVAWFDEMLSHDTLGTCRGSGVLVKVSGAWKVAQYNLSLPIPNELVDRVADQIRTFENGNRAP